MVELLRVSGPAAQVKLRESCDIRGLRCRMRPDFQARRLAQGFGLVVLDSGSFYRDLQKRG